jgi:cytochrome c553
MQRTGVCVLVAGLLAALPAAAQDADMGRNVAATCANCHGTDGKSRGAMPMLAGYPADKMITMLAEFKSGARPATIMHQIARGYTDEQIRQAARYLEQQK